MWYPEESDLGSVNENVTINHVIEYYDEEMNPYEVEIVPIEVVPTLNVIANTISGFYTDSFDISVTYRTPNNTFVTVPRFNQIPINNVYAIVSYKASLTLSKTFSYVANAKINNIVISSKTYTKTVTNDWTEGKNNLQYYVGIGV
jgi:hypothetical protein